MFRNYYTLVHLAKELSQYIGWKINTAFTQEKDQLVIEISNKQENKFLIFNSNGKNDSLFVSDRFARAKTNTTEPLHDLHDENIRNIVIVEKNRIIKMDLDNLIVYFQLFGGANSNIFLTNFDNKIFDAFKQSKEYFGKVYTIENNEEVDFWDMPYDKNLLDAIASSSFMFGKFYTNILLNKLSIEQTKKIGELNPNDIEIIRKNCEQFCKELLNAENYYVYNHSEYDILLTLIELENQELLFKSNILSESIRFALIKEIQTSNFEDNYKKVKSKLESIIKRNEKKLSELKNTKTLDENAKNYRKFGEAILSQEDLKISGKNQITINNWNGENLEINLDPKLNLNQNAKKYFDKAKNSEKEKQIRLKRIPLEEEKIKKLNELYSELKNIKNIKDLDKFVKNNSKLLEMNINEKTDKTSSSKFREFDLGHNYTLYVGKSAANNDELTMKFAKPNDLWLHARGTSGSHAIIKLDKETKIPKEILSKAAEITAYYSGARNAKYVPVVYTYKKYVKKPKGANPGAVVISKEEVIMVEPKLPNN